MHMYDHCSTFDALSNHVYIHAWIPRGHHVLVLRIRHFAPKCTTDHTRPYTTLLGPLKSIRLACSWCQTIGNMMLFPMTYRMLSPSHVVSPLDSLLSRFLLSLFSMTHRSYMRKNDHVNVMSNLIYHLHTIVLFIAYRLTPWTLSSVTYKYTSHPLTNWHHVFSKNRHF